MLRPPSFPLRQTLALAAASAAVALPAILRQVESITAGAGAIAWTAGSTLTFWAGVGAHFRLRDARTVWLQIAWLGAFLQLDISLRYRVAWALGVGALLLAARAFRDHLRDHASLIALLGALPLVSGRSSPSFVALGPACLLLACSPHRALRGLSAGVAVLSSILYTSAWPRTWGGALTYGHRSKAWGALLLLAIALALLSARAIKGRDLSLWRPVLASGLLYLVLALAWSHPLPFHLESALAMDSGDPMFATWVIWWNAQAVPFTQAWWDAPFLHPLRGTLALSEHLFGLALLTTPLQWLGLSAVGAYNLAFVLSLPLSAAAAHALAYRLTYRHDAALLGGLALGFAPYRLGHLSHIQVLFCFALPLSLLGLHGYLETRRLRWLLLFAGAWLLQGLMNGYFLLYLPVLAALWLAWFLRRGDVRTLLPVLLAVAAVALAMAPILLAYASAHERLGLGRRPIEDIEANSAVLASWASVSPFSLVSGAGLPSFGSGETWLYPGLAATGLVVAAWVAMARHLTGTSGRWPVWGAFGCGLAAGSLAGRWSAAVTLFAVTAGLGLVLAASGTVRAAVRERTPLAFYSFATIILWLLCLGPNVRVFPDGPALAAGPFAALLAMPGFDRLRSPGRFAVPAAVCLSTAAALAAARLLPTSGRRRLAWTAVAGLVIVFEGWISWLPTTPLPRREPLLEQLGSEATVVLELPMGLWPEEYAAMYRAMFHGRALINGFSGHIPPHYFSLARGLRARDPEILRALEETGAVAVLLHHGSDEGGEWARILSAMPDARLRRRAGPSSLYLLAQPPPGVRRDGPPLVIESVRVSENVAAGVLLRDGDLRTSWTSTEPQSGREVVEVRLAAESDVAAVVLSLGPHGDNAPRRLCIETSRDGLAWMEVWSGSGQAPALRGALRDPRVIPARHAVPVHRASRLRLRQLGTDKEMLWSIAELEVLGPAPQSASADGWQAGHQ